MSDPYTKLYESPEGVDWKAHCKKAQKSVAEAHEQRQMVERQARDLALDRDRWKRRAEETKKRSVMNLRAVICLQNTQDQIFKMIHEVDGLRTRFITVGQHPPMDSLKAITTELYKMVEQLHVEIEKETDGNTAKSNG